MLKKIWLFIKTFKLNFEIQNDFKKEFDKEIQDHK